MPKARLDITVRWTDNAYGFRRDAPELPPGVCWTIGMDFLDDELDFRVKRIFVHADGDVFIISSDVCIDEKFNEKDLKVIVESGWQIIT